MSIINRKFSLIVSSLIIIILLSTIKPHPNDDTYIISYNNQDQLNYLINSIDRIIDSFPYSFQMDYSSRFFTNGIVVTIPNNTIIFKNYKYGNSKCIKIRKNYIWFKNSKYSTNFKSVGDMRSYFQTYFMKLDELRIIGLLQTPDFIEIYTNICDSSYQELKKYNAEYSDRYYTYYQQKNSSFLKDTSQNNYYYVILKTKNKEVINNKSSVVTLREISDSSFLYRTSKFSCFRKIGALN